ncbi:MAG: hypothetical protein QOG25_2623 [Acetobacteraceae bacterium]|nr:hypothetical protein [Acetobacteraceae bacterium]
MGRGNRESLSGGITFCGHGPSKPQQFGYRLGRQDAQPRPSKPTQQAHPSKLAPAS